MEEPAGKCRIASFTDADRPLLERFFREVWLPPPLEKSSRWFDWLFLANPHAGHDLPTLLLAHFDGRVAGMLALVPTPLWIEGKPRSVAWGRDLFVDPSLRRHRIGLQLNQAWTEAFEAALGSGQSATMRSLQLKHGWSEISVVHQNEKLFFDAPLLHDSLGEGVTKVCKRAAAMVYAHLRSRSLPKAEGYSLSRGRRFDPRVDSLWEACRAEYPRICSRDLATLAWRFEEHPYYRYQVIQLVDGDGTYRGYLVSRQEGKVCWIVDLLTRRDDSQARKVLISAVEASSRREGVTRFNCRSVCAPLETSLHSSGYLATTFEQYACLKSSGEFPAGDGGTWFITGMDSDLDR